VTKETKEIRTQMKEASELHGHMGPFLVIGVRMGETAKQILNSENQQDRELYASVRVPLLTPFSCVLDGIQSTTHCTIGNQRLRVKKSRQRITAQFETTDSDKTLTITVNPKMVKELIDKISKGAPGKALAEAIASTPEHQLLKLNITKKHH
jgi:formylmethanofuran dehydrogenase subunit E